MAKYLASTSTYVDLPIANSRLSTRGVVYKPYKYKVVDCYVDSNFTSGWYQSDSDNAENFMSCTVYVIMYVVFPVLRCSKFQLKSL